MPSYPHCSIPCHTLRPVVESGSGIAVHRQGLPPEEKYYGLKFWMEPVELEFSQGLKVAEISKAEELIFENLDLIKNKWNEVFGG